MNKQFLIAILLSVLSFLTYLPLTAIGVQESDGAEMAYQAMQAGILHPPGFPLYSLISIALVKIFPTNPYHTLAIFSAFCQALAGGFIFLTIRQIIKSTPLSLALAISWLFFPATFRTATDCEVFGLNNLLCSLICYLATRLILENTGSLLLLGIITGLSWSNHQMAVFFTPLVLAALLKNTSLRNFLQISVGLLIGLTPNLYLVWNIYHPDPNLFFPLETWTNLWEYITRSYYGSLSLKHVDEADDISYLWHFLQLTMQYLPLALLGLLVSIIRFNQQKYLSLGIIGCVLANLWFASQLIYPNQVNIHGELLMRFYPGILLALLLTIPLFIRDFAKNQLDHLGFFMLIIIPIIWNFPSKYAAANAGSDRLAEAEIQMIINELPDDAIFISNLDRQTMGIPYYLKTTQEKKQIHVVIQGAITNDKYRQMLSKEIFKERDIQFYDYPSFLTFAFQNKKRIFTLEPQIPDDLVLFPHQHTWEILASHQTVPLERLLRNQLLNCARLPVNLMKVSEHRHNSQILLQKGFLSGFRWLAQHPQDFPEKKLAKDIITTYQSGQYQTVQKHCQKLLNNLRNSKN